MGFTIALQTTFFCQCASLVTVLTCWHSSSSLLYLRRSNVLGHEVQNTTLLPGQVYVTQAQFEDLAFDSVQELWTKYGNLTEIWFDGEFAECTPLFKPSCRVTCPLPTLCRRLHDGHAGAAPGAASCDAGSPWDMRHHW